MSQDKKLNKQEFWHFPGNYFDKIKTQPKLVFRFILSNNNQYQGYKEQRALFRVLGIGIWETQIWVKPKKCSGEEKGSGAY